MGSKELKEIVDWFTRNVKDPKVKQAVDVRARDSRHDGQRSRQQAFGITAKDLAVTQRKSKPADNRF
jgi:hypothetical protein